MSMFSHGFNVTGLGTAFTFIPAGRRCCHIVTRHPPLITRGSASDNPSGGRSPAQNPQLDTPQASKKTHNSIHNRTTWGVACHRWSRVTTRPSLSCRAVHSRPWRRRVTSASATPEHRHKTPSLLQYLATIDTSSRPGVDELAHTTEPQTFYKFYAFATGLLEAFYLSALSP